MSFDNSEPDRVDGDSSIFAHPQGGPPRLDPNDVLAKLGDELADVALPIFALEAPSRGCPSPSPLGYACPFFIQNPSAHSRCLRSDLQGMLSVKRHLWASHRRPYSCPICGSLFNTVAGRDSHIWADTCDALPEGSERVPASVSADQLAKLAWLDDAGLLIDQQWLAVWEIVFPGLATPAAGPMLPSDHGSVKDVSSLRTFWGTRGQGITNDFVGSKAALANGRGSAWEERDTTMLRAVALDRMIDRLITHP
ncbi:hypothetical protein B0T26DRAFT_717368 [Lasiosphaeria miniovina]|uniref:C2H2-type domain-containing protein n=1 Tax=Lasiosphaeria miniovina TaxID=1954250 RepID=A0AA40DU74_9PEZI|nr:uncharacterized protein B0T26DRAFT_717368 [Lasiosphaeria miniovina]KAK0713406.1 hypothetical protein B0T26DRAFT_717368 [Lasiosphaeria miniovina]